MAIVREAWASAVSQPVASVLTTLVIVGMVLAVMLTTGRTVGSEQRVLDTFDDAGTRTIQIRAEPGSGLTSDVLDRIQNIDGIEWSAAFSSAVDARNAEIPDGPQVPVRLAYGRALDKLGVPTTEALPSRSMYGSPQALETLGLVDNAGSITLTDGRAYEVAGEITTPDFLRGFEPLALVPQPSSNGRENVNVLVVIADRPDLVAPVSAAVLSVLDVQDVSKVTVQSSEALAQLRTIVQAQLGSFSRGLVLVILGLTGLLVALVLYALIVLRRKDFGRRRALGATRGLIVGLLLTQTMILTGIGLGLGIVAALIALALGGDPLPGPSFTLGLSVMTLTVAGSAAIAPATLASTREPIRELRIP